MTLVSTFSGHSKRGKRPPLSGRLLLRTMTFLIISSHFDIHAMALSASRSTLGHKTLYLPIDAMPFEDFHSLYIDNESSTYTFDSIDDIDNEINCVWFRRRAITRAYDYCEPWSDEDFKRRTLSAYTHGLYEVLQNNLSDALWINPVAHAAAANSKQLQLEFAVSCGLKIPKTLFSNSPRHIREFCKKLDSVIVKAFIPFKWRNEESAPTIALTSVIKDIDSLDDDSLSQQPAIYQEKLLKASELRYTIFGDYDFCVEILSQKRERTSTDWREAPPRKEDIRPFKVEESLRNKCRLLMKRLGINFGCLDFIVTPNGEYIFLEVNEAGQFLWIEELCPDIPLLDAFTAYTMGITYSNWRRNPLLRLDQIKESHEYKSLIKSHSALAKSINPRSKLGEAI